MTRFQLGIMNYFAAKRWPEPEIWTEIIGTQFDLDLVQFSFELLDPRSSECTLDEMTGRIVDSLNRYGVSMPSCLGGPSYTQNQLLHPVKSMRVDALHWWEKAIGLTKSLGAKTCGGFLGALSCADMINNERRGYLETSLIEDLNHLTNLGASLGQESFMWEAMGIRREIPATMCHARTLLQQANRKCRIPTKLILDVGKPFGWDLPEDEKDPYRWLRELGADSYCVHVQQTDKTGDRHWPFTKTYNDVGLIDPTKVIDAIESSGAAECPLILELSHPALIRDAQVVEDHKASVEYWKDALGL